MFTISAHSRMSFLGFIRNLLGRKPPEQGWTPIHTEELKRVLDIDRQSYAELEVMVTVRLHEEYEATYQNHPEQAPSFEDWIKESQEQRLFYDRMAVPFRERDYDTLHTTNRSFWQNRTDDGTESRPSNP